MIYKNRRAKIRMLYIIVLVCFAQQPGPGVLGFVGSQGLSGGMAGGMSNTPIPSIGNAIPPLGMVPAASTPLPPQMSGLGLVSAGGVGRSMGMNRPMMGRPVMKRPIMRGVSTTIRRTITRPITNYNYNYGQRIVRKPVMAMPIRNVGRPDYGY